MMRFIVAFSIALLFVGDAIAAQAQVSKYGIPAYSVPYAGSIQIPFTTVGKLPTCDNQHVGIILYATDASSPTLGSALSGGGTKGVLAVCNGSAWVPG